MPVSGENESGILVYPRLPLPKGMRSDQRLSTQRDRHRRGGAPIAAVVIAAVGGGAAGWFLQPAIAPDPRIAAAAKRAGDAEAAAAAQKTRAEALEKSLETANRTRSDAEARLAVAKGAETELA